MYENLENLLRYSRQLESISERRKHTKRQRINSFRTPFAIDRRN